MILDTPQRITVREAADKAVRMAVEKIENWLEVENPAAPPSGAFAELQQAVAVIKLLDE